ncbi:hypothetical protein WJX75_001370 [Coccomyxa subellipsoidea]|uniref:DNA helicase n=1 Tax=Coccomyxa subellipsoidea TaxID=248742 RepID=A0ABR2YUR1_9CHLO
MPSEHAKRKATKKPKSSKAVPKTPKNVSKPDQAFVNQSAPDLSTAVTTQVEFPSAVSARQRAVLHDIASHHGLSHTSAGDDDERRITLGSSSSSKAPTERVNIAKCEALSDEAICDLLREHFNIDGSSDFAAPHAKPAAPKACIQNGRKASGKLLSLEDFVSRTLPLLEMEHEAEVAQAQESIAQRRPEVAQARGRALLNLRLRDAEGGLLGRTLLALVSNKGGGTISVPLPAHKVSPHDVVELRPSKGDASLPAIASGVVHRVRDDCITVAVEDMPDEGLEQPLRLDKLANEVTYRRLKETLESLGGAVAQAGPAATLMDVLFGCAAPRFVGNAPAWTPVNARLDGSQRAAVSRALAAKDVALIHGPPGTGKTTAVVELILQEAARGNRVLAASASNIAVDNLVERLITANPKLMVVRVGHPARLLPQVLGASLEAHVYASDNSALARDCRRDIKSANAKLLKLGRKDYAERRSLRGELRALQKEERQRQQRAVDEVLKKAAVVCATLSGALMRELRPLRFDLAVIDEAAQALEAASWSALLKVPRAVLAGDHLQLPPTVISEVAARKGLSETLFERLQGMYGDDISEMLTVQYRMHARIMQWSSDELYGGRLTAHASVAEHTLADLKGVSLDGDDISVLTLIDTAGCGMEEAVEEDGDSKRNEGEAKVTLAHAQRLVSGGVRPEDIGIITPYNAQVHLLKELRPSALSAMEISSVDGFQGREKEAIIISMVRSNDAKQVGFLSDRRRMNVAVTRARRHCALVCDSETVSGDEFLGRLVQYFEQHGAYLSAAELVPD